MPETGYTLTIAQSARSDLEHLSAGIVNRVFSHIEAPARDPRLARCRKITGSDSLWSIRVGDYRVIYEVVDEKRVVDIVAVRHRSQVYR